MKKIPSILLIVFSLTILLSTANAQDKMDGVYKRDDKLDKFVGTWQWISGDSSLMITLYKTLFELKKDNPTAPNAKADVIIGWHEFSVKSVIIESSFKNKKDYYDYAKKDFTIHATSQHNDETGQRLSLTYFDDITSKRTRRGIITMLSGENDKILLELINKTENGIPLKYTFPKKLILKKIK